MSLLGLGSKFCPKPVEPPHLVYSEAIATFSRRLLIRDFFSHICPENDDNEFDARFQTVSTWLPNFNTDLAVSTKRYIFNFTKPLLFKYSPLKTRSYLELRLKKLLSNEFIKIVQSDKNLGLVALTIEQYHTMVLTHLNDSDHYICFGRLLDNPFWFDTLQRVLNVHLTLLNEFYRQYPEKKQILKFLRSSKQKLPVFHVLPKLHKRSTTITSRPIIGAVKWITTNWAIYLCSVLEKVSCSFVLKNSVSLIEKLENFSILESDYLLSADVSSLYTMMSLPRLFDCLESRGIPPFEVEIVRFICNNNFFCYGSQVYKQLDGIAMGFNAAVHCANIYLDSFDHCFAPKFLFYGRYIDDIFAIFRGSRADLELICLNMNRFIEGIKLTFNHSVSSVDFLDLTIFKFEHKIAFRTFQKPLNIYQYLPPVSCHPPACISGFIKGELVRFVRTNTHLDDRRRLCLLFRSRLLARGYSKSYLDRIFRSISLANRFLAKPPSVNQFLIPLVIPWFPNDITFSLRKLIRFLNSHFSESDSGFKFILAFKRNPSLLQLSTRSNISPEQEALLDAVALAPTP